MKKKALFTLIPALLALSLAATPALAAATPVLNYGGPGSGIGYIVTPGAIWYSTHYGYMGFFLNWFGTNDFWLWTQASPSFEWTVTNWHYAGNTLIMSAVPSSAWGGPAGPCPIVIIIQLNPPYHATVLGLKVFFTGNA